MSTGLDQSIRKHFSLTFNNPNVSLMFFESFNVAESSTLCKEKHHSTCIELLHANLQHVEKIPTHVIKEGNP